MTNSYELGEYLYTETTIRAPVRTVWPVLLDMSRWYTDYHWDWISGPLYDGVGLQEGQVLKAIPLYGAALEDPSLLTASDAKSMSVEYGTEVRDLVAFYHWHFTEVHGSTTIAI